MTIKIGLVCMSTENTLPDELPPLAEDGGELEPTNGLTNAVIRQAAARAASGAAKNAVRKEFKLSGYMTDKLYKHELFKSTISEITDDAVNTAKLKTRIDIGKLQKKAMVALEKALDKHSLEAVKVWLRAVGIEQGGEENKDAGGFTLVLANQKPDPKTIQVVDRSEE
jgi:hypothetical protein